MSNNFSSNSSSNSGLLSGQSDQLGQAKAALSWSTKKNSRSYHRTFQSQKSNTLVININTIMIKKSKKVEIDLR